MDQAQVEAIALRQMDPGERLLWSGTPAPGSVLFGWRASTTSRGFVQGSRVGFIGIPEVRNVERLIREHILERAA